MKLSIQDFFSKLNQIDRKMWILSHLPKSLWQKTSFFVCSGLNKLFLIIYFQCHYYFIYRVDDVRSTKNKI